MPARMLLLPALDLLMGILDHDDGRIDHRADGDGDAAQRHDVGVHPLEPHDDERGQHTERQGQDRDQRSEEHTSELQSLMRISYAVFCLKKKKTTPIKLTEHYTSKIKYTTHIKTYTN